MGDSGALSMACLVLSDSRMSNRNANLHLDRFFEHHLQTVAARLERHTDAALKRQRDAWREALHRQAVLDEKDVAYGKETTETRTDRRRG